MPISPPTVDELVTTLKMSSLPTVLVEGSDDLTIYRWFENKLNKYNTNFLPCGGRAVLLEIYKRRDEFAHIKTAFIADQDMWVFTSIPDNYEGVIWTSGYSIENDVCHESGILRLLDQNEVQELDVTLTAVISWFAFEVEMFRAGQEARVKPHINVIVPIGTYSLCDDFCQIRNYREPDFNTIQEIKNEYELKLRG